MSLNVVSKEPSEVAQEAIDVVTGKTPAQREPITRAEQVAVLQRFRLVDLINLVLFSASEASDKMSMTVDSRIDGTRVVVRVTHPRIPKAKPAKP